MDKVEAVTEKKASGKIVVADHQQQTSKKPLILILTVIGLVILVIAAIAYVEHANHQKKAQQAQQAAFNNEISQYNKLVSDAQYNAALTILNLMQPQTTLQKFTVHEQLGLVYGLTGNASEAQGNLIAAYNIDPSKMSAEDLDEIASIYQSQNNKSLAIKYLKLAISAQKNQPSTSGQEGYGQDYQDQLNQLEGTN